MNNKSIVLIGFMGVGKTTIGKELANHLNWKFVDIDEEIEQIYNMSTVDIFQKHGEAAFRNKEKEIIIEASKQPNQIISVGGGAFKQVEILNACMEHTVVIYLDLSFDNWKDRISILVETRPILQGKTMKEMKNLFDERQEIYQDHHISINLDERSIEDITIEIVDHVNRLFFSK